MSETILYTALSTSNDVASVVSNRIYSDIRDQGDSIPSIYYERTSTEFINTLDSYSSIATKTQYSVTCFESTRELCSVLSGYIISALAGSRFLCIDKEFNYDEESDIFSSILQFTYLEV